MTAPYADQHEFEIAGDNCRLTVRLHHQEMPGVTSGEDAGWVTGEVEMTAGTEGSFRAKRRVSIFVPDLVAFLLELEKLLETLTGEAKLDHLEGEFGCQITLDAGRGNLSAYVRERVGANLSVTDAKTEQSYVQATVTQLRSAIAAFPPRGG
jgi:hypothetical protein